MKRGVILGLVSVAMLAGCQPERYRSMRLGEVKYNAAYQTALATMRDYYRVESADATTGHIVGYSRPTTGTESNLLSSGAERETPELLIRTEGSVVWADIRIRTERLETAQRRNLAYIDGPGEIPDQTPAEGDAPFTPEQQESWSVTGHNLKMEREILSDLYRRLHE